MRYGTVGTSKITHSFIKAAKVHHHIKLSAVYSRTYDKAKAIANKYGAENIYTNLLEMAKSNKIDCVYLASPNSMHFEQAILFLKNNKHVICEKPIFSNRRELIDAYKVAKKNDVFLFEAMRNLYSPNFIKLFQASKRIGVIKSVFLQRMRYSSKYKELLNGKIPNVFSLDYSGGALMDLGIYPINLAVALFGKPKKVNYDLIKLKTGADASGTLNLQYDTFICTIMCSKVSTSFLSCEIQGEEGVITFDDVARLTNLKLINYSSGKIIEIQTDDSEENMEYEIEYFIKVIKERDEKLYEKMQQQCLLSLEITDSARNQNDIVFTNEL